MVISSGPSGAAAKLAHIAQNASQARFTILLGLLSVGCALLLGATLYRLTRNVDPDLALLGLCCRLAEAALGSIAICSTLSALWLSTSAPAAGADNATASAMAGLLFQFQSSNTALSAIFFAAGSALFSWLFLRGHLIPGVLAWMGVVASLLLVIVLPLQLAGFLVGKAVAFVWLPMALFEIPFAFWLLLKQLPAGRSHQES